MSAITLTLMLSVPAAEKRSVWPSGWGCPSASWSFVAAMASVSCGVVAEVDFLTFFLCRALMFAPSRAVHEVQRTLLRIAKEALSDAS